MSRKHIALVLLFFSSVFMAIAQKNYIAPSNLSFKNFTTKDGLTQSSIVSITQDSKGYLWFGTRDGLNKFDGTRFINYRHNSEDSTSISHSWVTCIFEDNDKNIWIGTKNGLNLFKPEQNNFHQIKKRTQGISVSDNQIWDITQANKDRIYVSTKNGVTDINYKKNISTYIKNDSTNLNSPSHNNTRCFLNTNDGYLWICTIEKIDRVHLATNTWEHYEYPKNTNKAAHISNTPVLFQDSRGTIWLGYENGIAFLPAHTTQFEDFLFKNEKKIKTGVRSIAEAENEINNGPTALAIDALDQVRAIAGVSPIAEKVGATANKTNFFNELVDERLRELCFEGLRKHDLIRWNLLGEKLNQLNETIKGSADYSSANENHNAFLRSGEFFDPAKHMSLPYPLQEVQLNNNLDQKSEW